MPRGKFQTLTEQMFYVLLSLNTERSGVEILEAVSALTTWKWWGTSLAASSP